MKKLLIVVIALLVIGGGAIFALNQDDKNDVSLDGSQETTTPATDSQDATSEAANTADSSSNLAAAATIVYTNSGFNPDTVEVKSGDRIAVRNDSTMDLDFASNDHPAHTDNSEYNIGVLEPGQTEVFTVTKTGTWGFHNHDFESHDGTVTVK